MLGIERGEGPMPVATMTTRGRLTTPKLVREQLHLKPHDKVVVIKEGGHAILYRAGNSPRRSKATLTK